MHGLLGRLGELLGIDGPLVFSTFPRPQLLPHRFCSETDNRHDPVVDRSHRVIQELIGGDDWRYGRNTIPTIDALLSLIVVDPQPIRLYGKPGGKGGQEIGLAQYHRQFRLTPDALPYFLG